MAEKKRVRDRAAVINDGFEGMTRWGVRLIVLALSCLILGWVIAHIWVVLFPIAIALIISTVLVPPATMLRRKGVPSTIATVVIVVGGLAIIGGGIAALAPTVSSQASEIASGASDGLAKIQHWLLDGPLNVTENQLNHIVEAVQSKLTASAGAISAGIFSTIGAATSAIVNLVLILMLTFFFVKDGHKFVPWVRALGGRRAGDHLADILVRTWATLGGFIRTQGLVSMIDAVIIGIGLLVLGVPLAIPLAVITFIGGFIPIIGAFVTGALAVLVTLVTNSPKDALIVLIIIVGVQQLEGNILSPWLQGRSMKLHAAVVLLAVAAGGVLFGITGAFLAVPVAATVAEILRYINEQIDKGVERTAPSEDSEAVETLDESP